CLLDRGRLLGGQVPDEVHQHRGPVAARIQRLSHESRTILLSRDHRLIPIRAAGGLTAQPALLAQVVHHRHDGGVGDRPLALQVAEDVTNGNRTPPVPDLAHHPSLKIAEYRHGSLPSPPVTYYADSNSGDNTDYARGGSCHRRLVTIVIVLGG